MTKKAKRGRPFGSKNKKIAAKVDVDKFLSPEKLAMTASEIKAAIRQLNSKLKAISALMRALKKEGK